MAMQKMPAVRREPGGMKYWEHTFERFRIQVVVPEGDALSDIVNFGFAAPYLLLFTEQKLGAEEAVAFAEEKGFTEIAAKYSGSVALVYPTCEGGWKNADEQLFIDLVAESRIQQYYEDGFIKSRNRFTGEWGEYYIRGAIFRTCLYGWGHSADYIARCLLKKIDGLYLWGPGEITPLGASLCGLSVVPKPERRDIPIVSICNSPEIEKAISEGSDYAFIRSEEDYVRDFREVFGRYKRWCGVLCEEPDLSEYGMVEEPACVTVKTSKDNLGDDAGSETHRIGYIAWYAKDLFENGPVPLVLAFHGGGDSALHIAHVSGWWRVAMRNRFLLVTVENHLNSTATEMVEFLAHLRQKYPIDESRIYASGFSMGGCKSWDLFQEYPSLFAALAPMDATFEVGLNVFGKEAPCEINKDVPVPVFYAGGEITPLPELPFQAEKCVDRIRNLFAVNEVKKPYTAELSDVANWLNPIWGIDGDSTETFYDESRDSVLTVHYFESRDGVIRTALASISGQGHECREHTCEQAWKFMSRFTRK